MKLYFSEHFFFSIVFSYLLNLKIIGPPNTLILPFLNIQWATLFLERSELVVLRS